MSDGDMYVFSDHIAVEVNSAKIINPDGWDFVQGCQPHARELHSLAVQWIAPMQMAQLAPGTRWCSTCGDVRPLSYFDVIERDADATPTKYSHECLMHIIERDPKLAKEKFCSACKVMHLRNAFADDEDYADGKRPLCYESERKRRTAGYAREAWLNEGREVRQYDNRVPRATVLRRA